jgi:hypothetical protein
MKQLFIGMNTDEHYWKDAMKPDDLTPTSSLKERMFSIERHNSTGVCCSISTLLALILL